MNKLVTGLVMGTMLFSGSVLAGDPVAGKAKSMVCGACHGVAGISAIDGYPNLAGQNEKYIISSIKAYRNKERNGGNAAIMQPQAGILSDQDIENLAAYYSQMK